MHPFKREKLSYMQKFHIHVLMHTWLSVKLSMHEKFHLFPNGGKSMWNFSHGWQTSHASNSHFWVQEPIFSLKCYVCILSAKIWHCWQLHICNIITFYLKSFLLFQNGDQGHLASPWMHSWKLQKTVPVRFIV